MPMPIATLRRLILPSLMGLALLLLGGCSATRGCNCPHFGQAKPAPEAPAEFALAE